jgi:hypothetical protein
MERGRLTSCFASLLVALLVVTPSHEAIAQAPGAAACLAQGQVVTGVLTFERATHPGNGSQLSAYVLQLPTVRCAVDYRQETYGVRQIHLVKLDDDPLRKLVGQRITVRRRMRAIEPVNAAFSASCRNRRALRGGLPAVATRHETGHRHNDDSH